MPSNTKKRVLEKSNEKPASAKKKENSKGKVKVFNEGKPFIGTYEQAPDFL